MNTSPIKFASASDVVFLEKAKAEKLREIKIQHQREILQAMKPYDDKLKKLYKSQLNFIQQVKERLKNTKPNTKKVTITRTDGTVTAGIFNNFLGFSVHIEIPGNKMLNVDLSRVSSISIEDNNEKA